jgi:transposase
MANYDWIAELLGLPNVQVTHYQMVGDYQLTLFVESDLAVAMCPTCHQLSQAVHDTAEPQMLRDLPIWNRRCCLRYAPRRFECATCGDTFVEPVAWREPGLAYTVRYEQHVFERARREPIQRVAHAEHLTEDVVQGIFARWGKKDLRNGATPR